MLHDVIQIIGEQASTIFGEESELPETLDDIVSLTLSFGDELEYDINLGPVVEIFDSG